MSHVLETRRSAAKYRLPLVDSSRCEFPITRTLCDWPQQTHQHHRWPTPVWVYPSAAEDKQLRE